MTAYLAAIGIGTLALRMVVDGLEAAMAGRRVLALTYVLGVPGLILLAFDTWGLA